MAANDTSGPGEANTEEAEAEAAGTGNPSDDVGAILDDMDEALEENAEEIVRSFVQEGGE